MQGRGEGVCGGEGEGAARGGAAPATSGLIEESALRSLSDGLSAVGLVASRDLAPGEEVLISYFVGLPNAHVFARFGFVDARPNRHDRILHLPPTLAPLSAAAVRQTTGACKGRWEAAGPLLEAALLSLPLSREPSRGAAAEVAAADGLRAWLEQTGASEFATSLEEDESRMRERASRRRGRDDLRRGAAARTDDDDDDDDDDDADAEYDLEDALLAYRVQRKRLWTITLDVLQAHQEVHGGGAAAAAVGAALPRP